jgi:anti-sigma regulatory factor (Ser/Thr protein kinase)
LKKSSLNIKADTSDLFTVIKAVIDFIGGDFDSHEAGRIVLAIDEAIANIIIHGYKRDNSGKIIIDMESDGSSLKFTITDNAPQFNPLEIPSPDMDRYFDAGKDGGLGVDIYKKIMDVSYEKNETGGNRLIMVRPADKKNIRL